MLSELRALFARPPRQQQDASFTHIMSMAKTIADRNPDGLLPLVRALLRPLQAEHMIAVAERDDHQAPRDIRYLDFFFDLNTIAESSEFYQRNKPAVRIDLARDIVLPTPWMRSRYANALANIGTGKPAGPWRADSNHGIAIWLPWRIGFVGGGNHSIVAGILAGEGEVTTTEIFDLTSIFDRVRCDGRSYRETATGRILGTVDDPRRAAVFEIGRLLAVTPPVY